MERGDDAVIRAVFCADPRPIRVSWRWAAFQMEAGSGSGRFVAEALHKVSPTILPPPIVELAESEDDLLGSTEPSNTNAYDTTLETGSTTHHPRSLEVVPTAQALVARPPQAVFTYPVCPHTTHPAIISSIVYSYRLIGFCCLLDTRPTNFLYNAMLIGAISLQSRGS